MSGRSLPVVSELVLASGSPRRRELLGRLGIPFRVVVPDVDETPRPGESAAALVHRLAAAKAAAVADQVGSDETIVAADTTVAVDADILAKPIDADDARRMLRRLSGRTHRVLTGVAVQHARAVRIEVVTTAVTFAELTASEIESYLATREPFDKAGGYAVQGRGRSFVRSIDGSISNVIGLPLGTVAELLHTVVSSR